MKKIIFSILLAVCFSFTAHAQISSAITYVRALNTGQYSCGTPGCITRAIEGHMHDTTLALMQQVYSAVTSSGNLNAVLTLGNTSAHPILINNGTDSCVITGSGISNYNYGSSTPITYLGSQSGTGELFIKNSSSGAYGFLKAISLTGNHVMLFPNEGTGIYPNDAAVLHTTSIPLTVKGSGTNVSVISGTQFSTTDGVSTNFVLSNNTINFTNGINNAILTTLGGIPLLSLSDPVGGFNYKLAAGVQTATRNVKSIDASGSIPIIITSADTTGATAAIPSYATFTPDHNETFQVSEYMNITAVTATTVHMFVSFTDVHSVSQTIERATGATISFIYATPINIRVKSGTAITIYTTLTGGASATYDLGINITAIN